MKDGWHVVCGYEVYVEDGKIVRGIKKKPCSGYCAAYVYRRCKTGGWNISYQVTPSAFRSGYKRGTVDLL